MLLNEYSVLGYGFAVAFFIVECLPRIKLLDRKPFKCIACMTGWSSLGLAIWSSYHWDMCLLLCVSGVTIGAIFEAIKMRWL